MTHSLDVYFGERRDEAIEADLNFVDFIYYGDLPEGSVQEAKLRPEGWQAGRYSI